jgi:ubiquinone/menaquinone biosynthesis C-methylase UbiE
MGPITTAALKPPFVPAYLQDTYWWAYVHPNAVKVFERQWLVNAILWGNFAKLRNAALTELGMPVQGRSLQIACVYGDFTSKLLERLAPDASLDVVDVLPIQLNNLRDKCGQDQRLQLLHGDSSELHLADAQYDQTILFFLLHEQPEHVRRKTLSEALRVTKPGGRLIIVDYHLPQRMHPLRYLFKPALRWLEPFALDLWNNEVSTWLPSNIRPEQIRKDTAFGGLYQKLVISV